MDALWEFLQWPAMAASLAAAWLVASRGMGKRHADFWVFLSSNALWIAWGWHDGAYALIALQLGLAALNVRGVMKNDASHAASSSEPGRD